MKRIIAILMLCVFALTIVGCGKPSDMSDLHYNYAKKAVEIADKYLDLEISASDAYDELAELRKNEDVLPEVERDNSGADIKTNVLLLSHYLSTIMYAGTNEDYQDVIDRRNDLAEAIGMKER